MKELLLIRHAKSSWDDFSIPDFDRPLNERGKRDAPEMAERVRKQKIKIDSLISSPAKRAKKTAEAFSKEFDIEPVFVDELYHANEQAFINSILKIPDSVNTVAIFSHNPGITDFANSLTPTRTDNIPTTGIFAVRIEADSWKDFLLAQKTFWFFEYPKKGRD